MNRGTINGLSPGVWQRFKPQIKCVGGTDPALDDTGSTAYQTAQVLQRADGRVEVIWQTYTIGSSTVGSGGPYAFRLPFPAYRPVAGACPLVLGTGQAYIAFVTNTNHDITPTLADPAIGLDDPDYYFQAYAPNILDWGTGAFTGGVATVTVNHAVGFAFNAEDLEISYTNGVGSQLSKLGVAWVTNITSTQFTLNRSGGFSGGAEAFSYKIRATPPTGSQGALVGPTVPWAWANYGAFGSLFFHLRYRPRR